MKNIKDITDHSHTETSQGTRVPGAPEGERSKYHVRKVRDSKTRERRERGLKQLLVFCIVVVFARLHAHQTLFASDAAWLSY